MVNMVMYCCKTQLWGLYMLYFYDRLLYMAGKKKKTGSGRMKWSWSKRKAYICRPIRWQWPHHRPTRPAFQNDHGGGSKYRFLCNHTTPKKWNGKVTTQVGTNPFQCGAVKWKKRLQCCFQHSWDAKHFLFLLLFFKLIFQTLWSMFNLSYVHKKK